MQGKFLEFIASRRLIDDGEKILLAISGGVDSVCLAYLFHSSPYEFAIAHCNFQLRGDDSDEDEFFVKNLAEKLNVPFHSIRFNTEKRSNEAGISIQMAARELRYEWFDSLIDEFKYHKIATAHHLNDSIETAIFNLAKGTGIAGLRGIKSIKGSVIRPILSATKKEILSFAKTKGYQWREDVSNQSEKYNRNYIRHSIVPKFLEINPSFENGFSETTDRLALAEQGLQLLIQNIKKQYLNVSDQQVTLAMEPFKEVTDYVLLYELIKPYGFSLRQAKEILGAENTPGKGLLSKDCWLVRDRNQFVITKRFVEVGEIEISTADRELKTTFGRYKFDILSEVGDIKRSINVAMLDFDTLKFPLKIRSWKEGEKFVPLGMKGKKKVSDFMIDNKIPLNLKKTYKVFTSGEEIIWLVGMRLDDRFKITDKTKKVYQIEFNKNHV